MIIFVGLHPLSPPLPPSRSLCAFFSCHDFRSRSRERRGRDDREDYRAASDDDRDSVRGSGKKRDDEGSVGRHTEVSGACLDIGKPVCIMSS